MQHGVNVLALVKDSERYVFLYDDEGCDDILKTLGRYAADNELSFTWYDAAVLSRKVRRLRKQLRRNQSDFHVRKSDSSDVDFGTWDQNLETWD